MATRKNPAKQESPAAPPLADAALLTSNESASSQIDASRGYTVLARRYRSRNFAELIGQEPIARTLRNAIAQSRVAHAYLFCGTRGVGKTSMARIFATALNVSDQVEAEAIRAAILRGQDMDVIEIDGASNRGIDDARDLIAAAGISPARSPYKIYIIDEVHMLTTPAFNALLKTMEEPPSHVKFILCTTEPHKVPATIQSRCQRFDFRSIPAAQIVEHLRDIFAREETTVDDEVVRLIARQANGSMRDALSLADRLIAASDGALTRALAEEVLGLPDGARVAALVDSIRAGDAATALQRTSELLEQGVSVERSLELLADRFRMLMLASICGPDSELIELGAEARAHVSAQAMDAAPEVLVHHIAICDAAARHARGASTPRTILDAAIVRLSLAERFTSIHDAMRGETRPFTPASVQPPSAASPTRPSATPPPVAGRAPVSSTTAAPPPSAAAPSAAPRAAPAPPSRGAPESTPQKKSPVTGAELSAAREAMVKHPTVRKAMDLFDAQLQRIERAPRAEAVSDPAPEDSEEAHPPS